MPGCVTPSRRCSGSARSLTSCAARLAACSSGGSISAARLSAAHLAGSMPGSVTPSRRCSRQRDMRRLSKGITDGLLERRDGGVAGGPCACGAWAVGGRHFRSL